jgi:hypothetical protein
LLECFGCYDSQARAVQLFAKLGKLCCVAASGVPFGGLGLVMISWIGRCRNSSWLGVPAEVQLCSRLPSNCNGYSSCSFVTALHQLFQKRNGGTELGGWHMSVQDEDF